MSLKPLEEAIKNLEKLIEQAKQQSDFYEVDNSFNQWFKDFKIRFDAFKKQVVCIPKNKLEEFITFLYSQAPLFCTHGKNELDCMKSDSPCKRKHRKDCPVYLRITKLKE